MNVGKTVCKMQNIVFPTFYFYGIELLVSAILYNLYKINFAHNHSLNFAYANIFYSTVILKVLFFFLKTRDSFHKCNLYPANNLCFYTDIFHYLFYIVK